MTTKDAKGDSPAFVAPTGLEFQIIKTKLYVPVVTLSKKKHLQMSIGYLFCRLQEIMQVMTETLFQTIIYQTLK